jgi:hypothetical protein
MAGMHPTASNPERRCDDKIRRLVVVGTPNYGTPLGNWAGATTDVHEGQAEQMTYGSYFLWALHTQWAELVQRESSIPQRVLVVAGTGGPGESDGAVDAVSAALPSLPEEQVRYVPYVHVGGVEFLGAISLTGVVQVRAHSADECSAWVDPYCADTGPNHKTFRFLAPFLVTGQAPTQVAIWPEAPSVTSALVTFRLAGGGQLLSEAALRGTRVDGLQCPEAPLGNLSCDPLASTVTRTGLDAGARTFEIKAPGYLAKSVTHASVAGRPDAAEVVLDYVDLSATSVSDPPKNAKLGSKFWVTDTIRNNGTATAPTSRTGYYLVRGAAVVPLTGARSVPSLAQGAENRDRAWVTIPYEAGLMLGPGTRDDWYLRVCADVLPLFDPDPSTVGEIEELNEANNCATSATTVKVRVSFL